MQNETNRPRVSEWLTSVMIGDEHASFFGQRIGLHVRMANMRINEGILTWDPFQRPEQHNCRNTLNFPAGAIGMLLRIHGML